MQTNKLLSAALGIVLTASFLFIGCSKDSSTETSAGNQNVSLYLTDGPGHYDKVVLDIKSVEVIVDTSRNTHHHDNCNWDSIGKNGPRPDSTLVWKTLNVKAGLYDVLQLRNGVDTLLASASIPKGAIRLIKISLGNNNSVTKDSVTYPLITLTSNPVIIIKLRGGEFEEHQPNSNRLWLDFDVERSIIRINNTTFLLRPFINCFLPKNTGTIAGLVGPKEAKPAITVYNATDTAFGLPQEGGLFKIRGLKDGTYSVKFTSNAGFKDTTINNVVITNASTVVLNPVLLKK